MMQSDLCPTHIARPHTGFAFYMHTPSSAYITDEVDDNKNKGSGYRTQCPVTRDAAGYAAIRRSAR